MTRASLLKSAALLVSVAALTACSVFGDSNAPKPSPLEAFTPELKVATVWNKSTDTVGFPLSVATPKGQFVLASGDGVVRALAAQDGAELWRAELKQSLSAGVGSDGRFAAVVTRKNELTVLEQGQTKWSKTLVTPVVAAPLVAGERVFVLTVDRAVLAFDAQDGRKLWELRRPGEPLTLKQAGVIAAYQNTLLVGQGARLTGVDPNRGSVQWEAAVANPRGTNEVERLADLVAPHVRAGDVVCARSFQFAVGCVNAARGTPVWSRNVGGNQGIGGDAELVVGADASDRMTAWSTRNGDVVWTAQQFQHRKLGVPAVLDRAIVVGDAEGYVHFLSRDKGKTLQRITTDGSAIAAPPVVSGTTLLVVTRRGALFAIRPQ
ncbi:outer membrane protein assembly factor BamB [Roseateles sp. BYS180W]|uniref:Outer membrane protein assembly factor BamB n=1 Tax=Roseateles rivi TaxID=3299028 RepID=A0ABW7FVU4_9BURK